jgi:hypothetical protein
MHLLPTDKRPLHTKHLNASPPIQQCTGEHAACITSPDGKRVSVCAGTTGAGADAGRSACRIVLKRRGVCHNADTASRPRAQTCSLRRAAAHTAQACGVHQDCMFSRHQPDVRWLSFPSNTPDHAVACRHELVKWPRCTARCNVCQSCFIYSHRETEEKARQPETKLSAIAQTRHIAGPSPRAASCFISYATLGQPASHCTKQHARHVGMLARMPPGTALKDFAAGASCDTLCCSLLCTGDLLHCGLEVHIRLECRHRRQVIASSCV